MKIKDSILVKERGIYEFSKGKAKSIFQEHHKCSEIEWERNPNQKWTLRRNKEIGLT